MSTHINAASKDNIAETILLPGDPLRAKFIAENYLRDVKLLLFSTLASLFPTYIKSIKC